MEDKEEDCQHYNWYNDEEGIVYCLRCNKEIGKLERQP